MRGRAMCGAPGEHGKTWNGNGTMRPELDQAQTDRRDKLLSYKTTDSLPAYLLVAQDEKWVEVYRRTPD